MVVDIKKRLTKTVSLHSSAVSIELFLSKLNSLFAHFFSFFPFLCNKNEKILTKANAIYCNNDFIIHIGHLAFLDDYFELKLRFRGRKIGLSDHHKIISFKFNFYKFLNRIFLNFLGKKFEYLSLSSSNKEDLRTFFY